MTEEQYISDKDARQIIALNASLNIATAYCQRCFVDINRGQNRTNCQEELEILAETGGLPADASAEELLDICKNCDYKIPYVADALHED